MLELKHFQLVSAIAEAGSLSGAARLLGYSQPAVSQQLQVLERGLRTPVVVRSAGGVRLTEAGEVLRRHAGEVLARVARARTEVEAVTNLSAGRVRLVCFPSAAAHLLPTALGAMRRAHPGLSFALAEAEPGEAYESLRRGECEIAIVYRYRGPGDSSGNPDARPEEVVVPLLEESTFVALPLEHPAAGGDGVEMSALGGERWIAGCPRCRGNLVALACSAGYEPDIAFETDDHAALLGLAAAGLGVALLTELMVPAALARPELIVRPLWPGSVRVVDAVTTAGLTGVGSVTRSLAALQQAARTARGGDCEIAPLRFSRPGPR